MKRNSSNRKITNSDTLSALVLVGISGMVADDGAIQKTVTDTNNAFRCYNCGETGHSQYKCPLLTKNERQALYLKYRAKSSNNINAAVVFHLGGELCNDGDTDESSNQDRADLFDPNCGNNDEADDRFVFCQITEDNPYTDTDSAEDDKANRNELIRALTNVADAQ